MWRYISPLSLHVSAVLSAMCCLCNFCPCDDWVNKKGARGWSFLFLYDFYPCGVANLVSYYVSLYMFLDFLSIHDVLGLLF